MAERVTDPRRHNILHPLQQMIVMAVVAILCEYGVVSAPSLYAPISTNIRATMYVKATTADMRQLG